MSSLAHAVAHRARRAVRFPTLVALGMVGATLVGVVATEERLLPPNAAMLLTVAGPVVAVSLVRPAWVLLGVLIVPPGLLGTLPASALVLVALGPLVGFGLRRWTIDLRPRSGAWPLLALGLLGAVHTTTETGAGLSFAGGLHDQIVYYGVLVLLAYNLVRAGEVSIHQLLAALLAGVALSSLLELGVSPSPGQGPGATWTFGRSLANLAAMGLSVLIARVLMPQHFSGLARHRAWNMALAALFGAIVWLTLLRASWLAIAIVAVVAVWRAGLARWLVILPLAGALLLTIPVARERVVPDAAEGAIDLSEYTTGRWRLWTIAAGEVDPSAIAGRGWGTWWSFSPEEVFDGPLSFVNRADQDVIFPHNDALLLMIDLGWVGLALLATQWTHLIAALRRLLLASDGRTRALGVAFSGTAVMFLITEMVGNGLVLRGVAERWAIVAGAVFALAADRQVAPSVPPAESSTARRNPSVARAS